MRSDLAAADRGATEAVAVALLVGIVVIGVTTIGLVSGPRLAQSQETVEVRQAERALVQFDAETARVATGGTTSQQVDLGLKVNEGTLEVRNDTGRITVEHTDLDDQTTTEVMNASLGAVVYENGETTVAYQGGGVWRSDGNGSTMVSPPEITHREKTLTMPVVRVRGGSVYSTVQVDRTSVAERFPDAAANLTNRLTESKVVITVRSRYYRAWGAYFEDRIGTVVRYDDADREVRIVFLAVPDDFAPDAGVVATSGPGELALEGTGAYVDSYDSSVGPYSLSYSDNGLVQAAGDVDMNGNSEIAGDVRAGRNATLGGSSTIDGNLTVNGEIDNGGTITGTASENGSYVISRVPIDEIVTNEEEQIASQNDNDGTSVIQNEELQIPNGGTGTLGPGRYYLENLDMYGETLVLNATGGDVEIAVEDWVRIQHNSEIQVQGNGTVRVYVASEQEIDESLPGGGQTPDGFDDGMHFIAKKGVTVDVPGDDASQFQVYGPRGFEGAVAGSNGAGNTPHATAVFVAPAGPTGSGQFFVQQGHLYGGVVTGNLTLGQHGQVHFDRGLLNAELLLGQQFARLEYLYVTEYEVEAESS